MEPLAVATFAVPGGSTRGAALLASSLRDFGGGLAGAAVAVLVPEGGTPGLGRGAEAALAGLGAELVPFAVPKDHGAVPFSIKVAAACAAERWAGDRADRLAWLDADTLVVGEPGMFLLPPSAAAGYRPVHHRLIGVPWGRPLDPFWEHALSSFGVPDGRSYPMVTHTGERIHPYLNAGCLVVRPGRGLLAAWWAGLGEAAANPDLAAACERSELHALFLHQVVLTAVVLARHTRADLVEFGPEVNYPLHLHHEVPVSLRPGALDDLVTARHEDVFTAPDWSERIPMSASLRRWLSARLDEGGG